jgi:circadian clock protein KaiC
MDKLELRFEAARPSLYGLEMHLARMNRAIEAFKPTVVVVDPISAFRGPDQEVHSTLLRMIDLLKHNEISSLFTSLRSWPPTVSRAAPTTAYRP